MAFAYCGTCEEPLDSPTASEILEGVIYCPKCSHKHHVDNDYATELLLDLIERVEKLEEKVKEYEKN